MLQTEESKNPDCYKEDTQEPEEEQEEEEALSLCDFPILEGREHEDISIKASNTIPDQELFEFFSHDHRTDICAADDIFLSGKILPSKSYSVTNTHQNEDPNKSVFSHMRSESLDERRSSTPKYRLMRSSFSVDCRKLERPPSSMEPTQKPTRLVNRVCSGKRAGIGEMPSGKVPHRPKWNLLILGSMRGPPHEMEMKDIRHRQMRQNPAGLFLAVERRGVVSGGKEEEGNVAWKLLRALSCKRHANADVTDPFGCIPHVRTA